MKLIAPASYFIDGDQRGDAHQTSVILHQQRLWLVATWQEQPTGAPLPKRIIPLVRIAHGVQSDGSVRIGLLMPKELLTDDSSSELLRVFGAQTYAGAQ